MIILKWSRYVSHLFVYLVGPKIRNLFLGNVNTRHKEEVVVTLKRYASISLRMCVYIVASKAADIPE